MKRIESTISSPVGIESSLLQNSNTIVCRSTSRIASGRKPSPKACIGVPSPLDDVSVQAILLIHDVEQGLHGAVGDRARRLVEVLLHLADARPTVGPEDLQDLQLTVGHHLDLTHCILLPV